MQDCSSCSYLTTTYLSVYQSLGSISFPTSNIINLVTFSTSGGPVANGDFMSGGTLDFAVPRTMISSIIMPLFSSTNPNSILYLKVRQKNVKSFFRRTIKINNKSII